MRYTGSVKQFQKLATKQSCNLFHIFSYYKGNVKRKSESTCRDRMKILKSEINTNLKVGNVKALRQREEASDTCNFCVYNYILLHFVSAKISTILLCTKFEQNYILCITCISLFTGDLPSRNFSPCSPSIWHIAVIFAE